MLGVCLSALDLSSLLQFVLTALALLFGALLVRKAASRYFVVDAAFEPCEGYEARRRMSIGGGETSAGGSASNACAVCRCPATKWCSRCKSVRYCSQACQSKHWVDHKLSCKKARRDIVSSDNNACGRTKSAGLGSNLLVAACGTCKVLQEPKEILFPYDEFVKLFNWDKQGFTPCGLINCGNSCFANVVLQCLACTRPLFAYLLKRNHSRGCIRTEDDWCFLCELQVHIHRASESILPFAPINILSRLPNIGGSLGNGSQEDAHEFMRFAIDTMQSVCLDEFGGEKALDPSTQETTLIHHIFGGYLQSQVICTKCNMISNRYENMMDLTVEIQGDAESLEECLDQFTTKEWLDGENMYKCDGCNDYVKACKRLTIHQAPNILTIALKRFQSGRYGKLNKRVTFPENLDLSPYMSGNGDGTDLYTLYAAVVHLDKLNASFYGHYICYIKDYNGHWYMIDDCKVVIVEVEEVLAQGAYMLLYTRTNARPESYIKPMEPARKKQSEVDPKASNVLKAANPVSVECLPANAGAQSNLSLREVQNDASLHRDPGHEESLSMKSFMTEEKSEGIDLDIDAEIKPMPIPKDLGDVDMDDSEPCSLGHKDLEEEEKPSICPHLPEDVSSAKHVEPDSLSLAEISSIEVQAIVTKPIPLPKDLGSVGMNDFEPSSFGPKVLEQGKSSSISSTETPTIEVQAIEVKPMTVHGLVDADTDYAEPSSLGSNDLDEAELDMDDSDLTSSLPKYLGEVKSSISPRVAEGLSSVEAMQSNSITTAEVSSIEAQAMDCQEPCDISDADIYMGVNSGSPSIVGGSLKLSKYTPDDSCSAKNIVYNMAETSSTAFHTTSSPVPGPSDDSRSNLVQVVSASSPSNSANRPDTVACASKRVKTLASYSENGSRGKRSPRGKSKPMFARGFLDKPARKESTGRGGEISTGNCRVALAPKVNGYINGHLELDFTEQNGHDIVNNSYRKSLNDEDKITYKELDKTDDAESSDRGLLGASFANENGGWVYKKDVAMKSALEIGSIVGGSAHQPKPVSGM